MRVVNRYNSKVYFVSLARVQKRIELAIDVVVGEGENVRFVRRAIEVQPRLQAAVYEYKPNFFRQVLSKPVLVVNLSDSTERVADEEFSEVVGKMFENERVEHLFDEDDVGDILDGYGFKSISKSIWSLYYLSKVRHAFVLKARN